MDKMEKYARNIALKDIGRTGQEKLARASVLIVGAGGLGSAAALYLAAAGVGRVGIVDGDVVDLSNLQRQVLHRLNSVGTLKAESARDTIKALNPDVDVRIYTEWLSEENAGAIFSDYDFIIDATDNFDAKFLINDTCVRIGKPFSHAGVIELGGQVMTYVPGEGPCYRCIFEEVPDEGSVPTAKEVGILGAAAGTAGCIQAAEAIKFVTGAGELLTGKMLIFDLARMDFRRIDVSANPDCKACGRK